ncbi:N-terminal phage integrase SAM-like domain-containing protein [Acidobacteria bacterium AH-259-D05]|nr:N-terminal phage integrase SAM-like domain-containing protein [Acidobacteria bacterium AH-259-D05]
MAVLVREWKGDFYVVIHFRGRRKAAKCESEEEAQQLAQEVRAQIELVRFQTPKQKTKTKRHLPTFHDYAEQWLREAWKTHRKQTTMQRYESSLKTHLVPYFGRLGLGQIDYSLMKEFCIKKQDKNSKDGIRLMDVLDAGS